MQDLVNTVTAIFDQLNPFNPANLILYFGWLVIYCFTGVAVWRSARAWLRFLCFLINQLFSIGVLLSWTLTGLLAYTYWAQSLLVAAATVAFSLFLFRKRPRRVD